MPAISPRNTVTWADFSAELTMWTAAGRKAEFWWRDDDATEPSVALDRLLELAEGTALTIAVIPFQTAAPLAALLAKSTNVSVLQHGYRHANHAPGTDKKAEFGPHRPLAEMLTEIESGKARLETIFGAQFQPVFVPPWNRMTDELATNLRYLGFRGVSSFGQRRQDDVIDRVDSHIDLIDWRGSRGFAGTETLLDRLIDALSDRRLNVSDDSDPVGILTHHLDHDTDCWRFMTELLAATRNHPSVEWRPISQVVPG